MVCSDDLGASLALKFDFNSSKFTVTHELVKCIIYSQGIGQWGRNGCVGKNIFFNRIFIVGLVF